jgi:putative ABC transport system substrate-binding protein
MKHVTSSIPVVFVLVNEPDTQGFVASLARPGGNITGFTNMDFSVIGKPVELLKTVVPALSRIGLMFNSDAYPLYHSYLRKFQAEPRRPVEVVRAAVRSPLEIDAAIDTLARSVASKLMLWMSNLLPLPVSRSLRPFLNGSWGSTTRCLPDSFHQSKSRSKSPSAS